MILEQVAIDFRCRGCNNIRRTDAELDKTIADQLPAGWLLETMGVCCPRCAGDPTLPTVPPPTAKQQRADAKREEVRKLRMPTAETTSLESPITAAASPLVSDTCSRCNIAIKETESWRPDPEAAGFVKAHRQCLLTWAQVKARAIGQGKLPEDM